MSMSAMRILSFLGAIIVAGMSHAAEITPEMIMNLPMADIEELALSSLIQKVIYKPEVLKTIDFDMISTRDKVSGLILLTKDYPQRMYIRCKKGYLGIGFSCIDSALEQNICWKITKIVANVSRQYQLEY